MLRLIDSLNEKIHVNLYNTKIPYPHIATPTAWTCRVYHTHRVDNQSLNGIYEIHDDDRWLSTVYIIDGYLHQETGPAVIIRSNGRSDDGIYFLRGYPITKEMFDWLKYNQITLPFSNMDQATFFKLTWGRKDYEYLFEWGGDWG